jgi:OOP family OmpA-OmpF porin
MKQRSVLIAVTAACAIVSAQSALAGAEVGSWYVAPKAIYVDPDKDFHADSAIGGSFAVGKVLSQAWDLELSYTDTRHDTDFGNKLKLSGVALDLNRVFLRDSAVNPYIGVGINSIHSQKYVNGKTGSDFGGSVQAGLLADLTKDGALQINAEIGERADDFKRNLADTYAALGLRFNFGGHAAAAPVVAPTPAPVAAPPPRPAAPPPPVDSDGDGVVDNLDKCPNTPAGARVDANGCELDSDKDGVVDRLDRCPNTPIGTKVDAAGCGITIRLAVLFDTNSATIKSDSYAELDNFVQFMKQVPTARGTLEGHTDNVGKDAYNLKLSQRRAESVQAYVVGKGIDASRIAAKGYGETKPIADNKTAEGRTENRRVQFVRTDMTQ